MTRKDIRSFISKYLELSGKPYEVLTEFRHYNQELVDQDKDKIYAFFSNIYNFSSTMSFKELEKNKNNEELYHLEYLYDLDEFEDLIGLLFASSIIHDDLSKRIEIIAFLGNKTKYLNREFISELKCSEEDYLAYLEQYILPAHRFKVNSEFLAYQSKNKIEKTFTQPNNSYSNEEIKDILKYWINKSPMASMFEDYINSLIENNLEDILNFAVFMSIINADGPTTLLFNILIHNQENLLNDIIKKYSMLSNEELSKFEENKATFINAIKQEMQNKNRRL